MKALNPLVFRLFCTAMVLVPLAARAQNENLPYVNLEVGVAGQTDTALRDLENPAAGGSAEVAPGYRVGLSFGYLLREGSVFAWRTGAAARVDMEAEVETGIIYNSLDLSDLPLADAQDLDLYRIPLLFNLGFHVPLREPFTISTGGGLGALMSYGATERGGEGRGADIDVGFAWQVFVDFSYDLNERLRIGAFYKLLHGPDTTFKDDVQIRMDGGYTHTLGISVRWLL